MYVYCICVYPAMSDLNKKDRHKRHSSPFINVVKGVFFVVGVTLVPVSYLSAPSAVHSYRYYTNNFLLYSFYTNKLFSVRINFPGSL
jgi:hypothetical protein